VGVPRRWKLAEWAGAVPPSELAPIVVGGCGSSGTTLVRHILDRHPAIFCGPESTLFLPRPSSVADLAERFGFAEREVAGWRRASPTRTAFIERFQAACLARSGKRLWADKTPENVRQFHAIRRRFPNAKLVHVVRDGRDVACSLRQADWMLLEKITGGLDRNSPDALEAAVRYWAERVRFARTLAGDPGYHELRYEELIARPQATLRALFAFLEVEWEPSVLQSRAADGQAACGPLFEASVGRWRRELSRGEAQVVEQTAGGLLVELGYAADGGWAEGLAAQPAWRPPPRSAPSPRSLRRRLRAGFRALRREAMALGLTLTDARAPFKLTPPELLRERRREAARRLSRRVWAAEA